MSFQPPWVRNMKSAMCRWTSLKMSCFHAHRWSGSVQVVHRMFRHECDWTLTFAFRVVYCVYMCVVLCIIWIFEYILVPRNHFWCLILSEIASVFLLSSRFGVFSCYFLFYFVGFIPMCIVLFYTSCVCVSNAIWKIARCFDRCMHVFVCMKYYYVIKYTFAGITFIIRYRNLVSVSI